MEKDNASVNSLKGSITEDGAEPTEQELATLRHIGDKIPISAWLVAVVELAERFTYYGLTGPWRTNPTSMSYHPSPVNKDNRKLHAE